MKIGEFAKRCGISISALRYYDERGLLSPVFIDRFTGYRFYAEHQIAVCRKIGMLKAADFSLAEIRRLLNAENTETIRKAFAEKRAVLERTMDRLSETEKMLLEVHSMKNETIQTIRENICLPFENDEAVLGRWEIVSEAAGKLGDRKRQIFPAERGTVLVLRLDKGQIPIRRRCEHARQRLRHRTARGRAVHDNRPEILRLPERRRNRARNAPAARQQALYGKGNRPDGRH